MPVNVQNTPRQEVTLNSSAPNIGADAGEIIIIDCTIASTDSRLRPLIISLTTAEATAPAALPPRCLQCAE